MMHPASNFAQSFDRILKQAIERLEQQCIETNQVNPAKKPLTKQVQFYIVHTYAQHTAGTNNV